MNASGILRKLKDLDALEKRIKEMVNPSPKMLQQIADERKAALSGDAQGEIKK